MKPFQLASSGFALLLALVSGAPLPAAVPRLQDVDRKILYGEVLPKYLMAFGNVIAWPEAANAATTPFRIGVLGPDPTEGALERLVAGTALKGRPIVVVRAAEPAALAECQIIFADQPTPEAAKTLSALCAGRPVLTVLFSADRTATGGLVELFLTKDGAIRYTLNVNALRQAGLTPSPEVLQLALRAPPR